MAKNYIQPGDVLTFTAPGGGVVSGTLYIIGGIPVIAMQTVAATLPFEGKVDGVWELPKVGSQAWTAGDKVYWDAGNARATKTATDGPLIGVAAKDVANGAGDILGNVRLNGAAPEVAEGPQGAIASLTDNGGGTADGTVAAQAEPVTLTDSTGASGSHDDTLAAPSVPADLTGGESPTEAEHNAVLAAMRIMNQNDSDTAQKVIELVTLSATAQDNLKEVTAKIESILVALRAAGVITA